MRALVYSAVRELTMQDVDEVRPREDQAVVRVIGTGICGSDMSGFLGHSARRKPPLVLGHEVIGVVESAPSGDWPFAVGDRVVANPLQSCGNCERCRAGQGNLCSAWKLIGMDSEPGAFAERVAVAARNLFPVPANVSDAQAVMTEPLANGVHLFGLVSRHSFGSLAIYGAGTQGILLLQLARLLGYRDIVIIDTNAARLEIAAGLGASKIVQVGEADPAQDILAWTDGRGVDVGIDAAGLTSVRRSLIHAVRKGGEIMLLGLHDVMSDVDFALVVRNEQRLQGSFAYTDADFQTAKRLLERGDISIQPWTETRPLSEGQASFDLLTSDPGPTLKIILQP